jgi:hypothetical protein
MEKAVRMAVAASPKEENVGSDYYHYDLFVDRF